MCVSVIVAKVKKVTIKHLYVIRESTNICGDINCLTIDSTHESLLNYGIKQLAMMCVLCLFLSLSNSCYKIL